MKISSYHVALAVACVAVVSCFMSVQLKIICRMVQRKLVMANCRSSDKSHSMYHPPAATPCRDKVLKKSQGVAA